MFEPLLAKSSALTVPEATLLGHTGCVLAAIESLFGRDSAPTPLAVAWLRFFGIPTADFDRFLKDLRVAGAAHDWGKANEGFQAMVSGRGEQAVRHEHLSGLLLAEPTVGGSGLERLEAAGLDPIVMLAAVVGHHVKAGERDPHKLGDWTSGTSEVLHFCADHADFAALWQMVGAEVGGPWPGPAPFEGAGSCPRNDIDTKFEALGHRLNQARRRLLDDRPRQIRIAAVRAALIAADAVGSAVVRIEGEAGDDPAMRIGRFVRDCFAGPMTGADVWEKVIRPRIEDLRRRGRWDDAKGSPFNGIGGFNAFQCSVPDLGPRALLTAPCGAGKTLAAWNWIKARLDERPASRVLFLYPTRATATEGFRDYASWAPEDEAGLLSGTANYELKGMFDNPPDQNDERKGRKYLPDERLFALGHWKRRIFSATADQIFPFMQYAYGPLCLLPLVVDSVVVVDEVHSFDGSMFETLRKFLRSFPDVPVLCMTATLSGGRQGDLIGDCGLKPYAEKPADLVLDAKHGRYHIEWIDREGARSLVRGELAGRRRVLWVSNRVVDCQEAFEAFAEQDEGDDFEDSIRAFCYHSRFKLDDRKARHSELIRTFQDAAHGVTRRRGLLGATTQVCEMSLDLDAEVLVTELAPISALIQRMGRCNRDSKAMKERNLIGRIYVIRPRPGAEKPYEEGELAEAKRFIDDLAGRAISQDDLEAAYQEFDGKKADPSRHIPFLDSGPYAAAHVETFREIDEYTVPCVLDHDLTRHVDEILKQRKAADRQIDGFLVPVPRRFATEKRPEGAHFPKWLSVAKGLAYDPRIGFDERKLIPTGATQP